MDFSAKDDCQTYLLQVEFGCSRQPLNNMNDTLPPRKFIIVTNVSVPISPAYDQYFWGSRTTLLRKYFGSSECWYKSTPDVNWKKEKRKNPFWIIISLLILAKVTYSDTFAPIWKTQCFVSSKATLISKYSEAKESKWKEHYLESPWINGTNQRQKITLGKYRVLLGSSDWNTEVEIHNISINVRNSDF